MYTRHGHHIAFTSLDEKRPEQVARCGGPRICPQCTLEAAHHLPALKEVTRPPYFRRGGDMDFIARARQLVYEYVSPRLEKTDDTVFTTEDVYVVWFTKTLQNWKALVSTNLPDGMYYELTYNGDKRETYIDAYKKFDNVAIPDIPEEELLSAFA